MAPPSARAGEPLWRAPEALAETPAWVRDAVFYEIFPDRFARSGRVPSPGRLEPWDAAPTVFGFKGGDLYGLTDRLAELVDLGITALYLTPIFTSAANHRYHTDDYLSVDPLLGGDEAFRALLDAAHARGMRVVLDGVFNHTGRGHEPFVSVLENLAASPYRTWYHFDADRLTAGRPITPYVADPGGFEQLGYRAWWDLPALPKLNHAEPAVRDFIYRVAERWVDWGIDGWRLDVPEEIREGGFWEGFRKRVRAARPDAYLVGEIWGLGPEWTGPTRFDALMNYPLAQAILGYCAGDHLDSAVLGEQAQYAAHVRPLDGPGFAARLAEILAAYAPATGAVQLNLLDSHDTPRFRTLAGGDLASLRLAVLLLATLPGAPCLYYGDELGLEGHRDPDSRRAYPTELTDEQRAFRASVRRTLQLRRRHPVLRAAGDVRLAGAEGAAMAFLRVAPDGADASATGAEGVAAEGILIAINAGEQAASLALSLPALAGRRLLSAAWGDGSDPERTGDAATDAQPLVVAPDGSARVTLAPRTGRVLVAK